MTLLKDRLIELRKSRGFSQSDLAMQSNVSRRQIARIETEPDANRRKTTIERLAKALKVESGVLTGELPTPELDISVAAVSRGVGRDTESVSARVSPEVRLAYDLVSTCFGVSQSELVRMAPLLLAVLAAGSFEWRRKTAEEAQRIVDQLSDLVPSSASIDRHIYHHYLYLAYPVEDLASCAVESVKARDLLGIGPSMERAYDDYYPGSGRAFTDYLKRQAIEANCEDIVEPNDIEEDAYGNLPLNYRVLRGALNKVSGGSEEFREALEHGEVRVMDIPEVLLADLPSRRFSEFEKIAEKCAQLRVDWFRGRQLGVVHPVVKRVLEWEQDYNAAIENLDIPLEI